MKGIGLRTGRRNSGGYVFPSELLPDGSLWVRREVVEPKVLPEADSRPILIPEGTNPQKERG